MSQSYKNYIAGEFRGRIAANALWPRTAIATAAISNVLGSEQALSRCRKPQILADAAYRIVTKPVSFTGNFIIDDTFLFENGVREFDHYRVDPTQPLAQDFFVPDDSKAPVSLARLA